MRDPQVLAIKTSTAKARVGFVFLVFAMLMSWGLLWLTIRHSTSSTPYGPFFFILLVAGIAPFACLGAYLKIKRGPKIRYLLTPHGLTYPDMSDKLIPWGHIRKTKLRYMSPGRFTPHSILFLDVDVTRPGIVGGFLV
jgi:hypothetical protein